MSPISLPSATPSRNPGIDLLRGLSILLVVVHHVGLRIPLKNGILAAVFPKWLIHSLIFNGYEAVFIFFVISGFLIASNSLNRWGSPGAIRVRPFYARRASRILPCLLALVAVLSFLDLAGLSDYVIIHPGQSLPRAILAALGLHLNWYEGHTGYLPGSWDVLWSLSIEEVFYLGFPLLCLCVRRDRFLVLLLAVLALSLPATHAALANNEIWQEKAYLPGMAAIAMGILGAIVAHRFRPRPWVNTLLQILGAGGLAAVLFFERWLWQLLGEATLLVLTTSTACLLLSFYWRPEQGQVFSRPGFRGLRSLGCLSYEVYLTHMFVVFAVVRVFRGAGGGLRWGVLWYFPAVAGSWALGWIVARYFSVPSERGLRSLTKFCGGYRPTLVG